MLALIAGEGELPRAVSRAQPVKPLICALRGSLPDQVTPEIVFRLERLGGFLRKLKARGVTRVCMCGRVSRPGLNPLALDLATLRLLPQIRRALARGDDGALKIAIAIFEAEGFEVIGAHELMREAFPAPGVPSYAQVPSGAEAAALQGDMASHTQSRLDLGQSCLVSPGGVQAYETEAGTDALLRKGLETTGLILYKAPKPGQERRADLPVIGPNTAHAAVAAGLAGIIIEARGVIVLDAKEILRILDAHGLFLWVRERPK